MSRLIRLEELEDGKFLEGESDNPLAPSTCFDMERFLRGRKFFRDNIFGCSFAMFFSLVIGLCFPNLLQALVFTNNSNTPRKAFKRYISTFNHIALWHYENVWKADSDAQNSVVSVRNLHKNVAQKMKISYSNDNSDQNPKFISQYDMALVMSGFMGCVVMYPQYFGINSKPCSIDDYLYFWYGIGHLLGIKHKYNICAYGMPQALSFCKEIEDLLCHNMEEPPEECERMAQAVIRGFQYSPRLSLVSVSVIKCLCFDAMKRPYKIDNLPDFGRFYLWKFLFYAVGHFEFFRNFLRVLTEKIFGLEFVE